MFIGGLPGGPELVVLLLLAVLLFGANKIPKLARSSGEAIGEFQKGREEVEQELQEIKQQDPDADDEEGDSVLGSDSSESSTTAETEEN